MPATIPLLPQPEPHLYERDRFGGSPFRSYDTTGYFRLERDDRWWFVDPVGHPFLSWGTNHIEPRFALWPNNRRYWGLRFGAEPSLDAPAFMAALEHKIELDLAAWGMNTLGCHSPIGYYQQLRMPYVHTLRFVDNCHWMHPVEGDLHDVFSYAFAAHCDALARDDAAPRAEDPYLLGYSFSDCPILTPLDAAPRGRMVYGRERPATPTWPGVLRNLGPESAGKRAYVALMRELYADDISAFNDVYRTSFGSFDDLLRARHWSSTTDTEPMPTDDPRRQRDYEQFLERVVDRYYEVVAASIRRHDPHHLLFGDKLNGNTGIPDGVMTVIGRHVDVVFFQWYGFWEEQAATLDHWAALTDKPLFNGDSSYSVPEPTQRTPLGPHCPTQEARTEAFWAYAANAFARRDFLGWNWCGWMDKTDGYGEDSRHSGLQDPFGHYDQPIQRAMADFGARMYAIALVGRTDVHGW